MGAQIGEQVRPKQLRHSADNDAEVLLNEAALAQGFHKLHEPLVRGHLLSVVFVIRLGRTGSRVVAVRFLELQRGL